MEKSRAMLSALAGCLVLGSLFVPQEGRAEDFPSRPITLVAPFSPGTPADLAARRLGQTLGDILRQPVVVENRTGAGGTIGSTYVAKAQPNGYTLLAGTQSTHAINVGLYKNLPYDPIRDFVPISRISAAPNVLVINPALKATTLQELIKLAKEREAQGKPLTFGSGGNGTTAHIGAELLNQAAGLHLVHIPYKGTSQATTDVISGQVDLIFGPIAVVKAFVEQGMLRALAITSDERSSLMPDVPTVAEAGLPNAEMAVWIAVFAPPKTPEPVVAILGDAIRKASEVQALKDGFAIDGSVVVTDPTPDAFIAFLQQEIDRWVKVVKTGGMTIE